MIPPESSPLSNFRGALRLASSADTDSGYPERVLTLEDEHLRQLGYAVPTI